MRATDMDDVNVVARRVLSAVQEPIAVKNRSLSVSGSIGIAVVDADSRGTNEDVLKQADEAMYAAKRSGKGRFVRAPRPETMYASQGPEPTLRPFAWQRTHSRAVAH